jgi:nitrate reductase molybdenum cofactor assembly chaperone NarJ/NarW
MAASAQIPVDRLASLLEYPGATFATALADCRQAIDGLAPAARADLDRFALAVDGMSAASLQELYVSTFDLNPKCTLDLGWHLFGDTYERGALLSMLREELQRHAVPENGELPDHLAAVVRLLERLEAPRRAELLAMLTPAFEALQNALASAGNPYAPLVKGVVTAATAGG